MKGILDKLKKYFMGPFKIQERIGQLAHGILLPETWKVHIVFHISLLREGILQTYKLRTTSQLWNPMPRNPSMR